MLPSVLFQKSLQMFLREANFIYPLRIFKCVLHDHIESKDKIVYMTSFFSMGLFTEAEKIRKEKVENKDKIGKYSHMEKMEIIIEKIKKINTMRLSMTYKIRSPIS